MSEFDLVIRNARCATAADVFSADIAITDGRIVSLGEGDSNHKFNIAPNLLDRDFNADAPNQKWAGDISCIWTREGWLYLAAISDLHSRRVIGWALSNRMKRDLAIRALEMAMHSVSRQRAASTIPTGAANIAPTIARKSCANMASRRR